MRYSLAAVLLSILGMWSCARAADAVSVPNALFDSGGESPAGWKLAEGKGRWVDRQILEVSGDGKDSARWLSESIALVPGTLYRFEVRARRISGSGTVMAGPDFANHDHAALGKDWQWLGQVFRVPDGVRTTRLHVGQWHVNGVVQFDAVRIAPVLPIHVRAEGLTLGESESVVDGCYHFQSGFLGSGGNYQRTLAHVAARFNTNRWCFASGSHVTYRFGLPGDGFRSGDIAFHVNHHHRGDCVLEVSRDRTQWQPLTRVSGAGGGQTSLPAELLPADVVFVRLRAEGEGAGFQVDHLQFSGKLTNPMDHDVAGRTWFAEPEDTDIGALIEEMTIRQERGTGDATLDVTVKNPGAQVMAAHLKVSGMDATIEAPRAAIAPGAAQAFLVKISGAKVGDNRLELKLAVGDQPAKSVRVAFRLPEYYREDYGQRIVGVGDDVPIWWCPATWKVAPKRGLPAATAPAATLSAARHDHQAVQVVVRPDKALVGLTATAGALVGPGGATIEAKHVKILRVYYHFVHFPTDATGLCDLWPDALPPLDAPIDVAAGENQPLWVLVYVPKDTPPGDYSGAVSLAAEGFSAQVPLKLHVWDFSLPERNHLATAFGFKPHLAFQYHQVKTAADRRRVLDMYLQSFADHRISPYDPVPLDPIRVEFLPEEDPPRAKLDFTAFDAAMTRAIEKYHFTTYRLPIHGMGGGTFHARHEPKIEGFEEDTPEYQAMFASYVGQLQDHLKAKGWLDMAYVYWFDEPEPKDYEFVSNGMLRLKKYAPELPRMLTEEPNDALQAVDIWCPVSFRFDSEAADRHRAHGERFWWYVCCGPKAPFCTLFIDHPATELRVWHWQTWQRDIVGTLIWTSNYWTSSAAYPDTPQNPYEDTMSYVSGYSTPKGVRAFWGNGDGRFIYPPLRAAVPGKSGTEPIFDPPVSSIRWEMLREGVEDYEYLYMLRERLAKHRDKLSAEEIQHIESLLAVPEEITKDMTTFTTDPAPIDRRRAAVAETIEQLGP